MPTRSVKLKLIIPRKADCLDIARGLWTTHAAVNQAARYYEEQLLLMRGQGYRTADAWVSEEDIRLQLIDGIHKARKENGGGVPITDEEAADLLHSLYGAIVPSAVGEQGTAQNANRYLGPLTDKDSRGELDIFEKIDRLPEWLQSVRDGEVSGFEAAYAWLETQDGQRRLRMTGAPPAWVKAYRQKDPKWPILFVTDVDRKLQEAQGTPSVVRRLKEAGVLPLFPAFIARRLAGARAAVGPWDRLAFRLAVSHLLSWESWSRRAAEEHSQRKARVERFRSERLVGDLAQKVEALRQYEVERKEELERVALPMDDRDFLITGRMVRNWTDLRGKWLRAKDRSMETLLSISAEEQTRKRGRFGDPHLVRWLARPENHHIWADPSIDPVSSLAHLNAMERLVERSRETATMTLPDPREHPRSTQWEADGGTNLRSYALRCAPAGCLEVRLPILTCAEDGFYAEASITLPVAPSDQLQEPEFASDCRQKLLAYRTGAGEAMRGALGSADLLLDWDFLRARSVGRIEAGEIGPAWLKLAIDLHPQYPAGFTGKLPAAAIHFQTSLGEKSKRQAEVVPGLRVLSIDLGVRSFGACSVFELTAEQPMSGVIFPVAELGLWAVHERSFMLDLPGEEQGRQGRLWREAADAELRRLRRGLRRHRTLLHTAGADEAERAAAIAGWREIIGSGDAWPFEHVLCAELEARLSSPPPVWEGLVKDVSHRFRHSFGEIVHEWRYRTRARMDRDGTDRKASGKSLWSIQHLTDVRRFLQGWSLAGRASGEVRRLNRAAMGSFAGNLLDHIDGLKDDRLKTGADLIVQAARGYRRGGDGKWVQVYAPCHVVLFEDLSRYRMRTDRPRRENSQLMKWAHRAIPGEVAMQGELYGIQCLETGAAFSSRYRAASMTPGIRCHVLTKANLTDVVFRQVIERENPGIDVTTLRPNDLVPLAGGEMFVCLDGDGVCRVHADINAAQNLQRRFWSRHGEAFRVPTRRVLVDGRECWVPMQIGKRLNGALGGYGRLIPTGHETGSCRWESLTPRQWRALTGAGASVGEANATADPDIEELLGIEEEALERTGETVVFFRDPSGVVLPDGLWFPSQTFWSVVKTKTAARLKASR